MEVKAILSMDWEFDHLDSIMTDELEKLLNNEEEGKFDPETENLEVTVKRVPK